MAVRAYLLIEIQVGKTKQVVAAMSKLNGVCSVEIVTGPYDAVAQIQGASLAEVGDLVTTKVHCLPGITRTVTCLVV